MACSDGSYKSAGLEQKKATCLKCRKEFTWYTKRRAVCRKCQPDETRPPNTHW